ncbi:MAG: Hpt domain-containing protein, partial [Steroidobacteraceae bacterium]|nr:Hpt domain-containing protein [Steroidobacteraceae bacterium]
MSTQASNVIVHDESHASLQLVSREIASELNEARAALEAFAENAEDRGALHRFAAHIHLARGALRLAEVYGGALLAEEMEQVARYVDTHSSPGHVDADGLDALMRAMEQLPSYVDRVASGGRDVPLALLPLLNDLRAVRGSSLLSEGTLLLLNLRSDEPAQPTPEQGASAAELARRLRPRFQLALLGWIRGEQLEQNLEALAEIAAQFESHAATQPLFQLWWVVSAVIEALRQDGLDSNVSLKRLLGHVDRELRRLHDVNEATYSASPPVELLNNLLFYVARARSTGPRVASVRASFRLDEVLAASEQAGDATETLSAPSVRLMKTVAAAIREDLTRVKDVLDIFVRKGATQVDDLVPQLEMLRKIADTLGVLGLGQLRDRVQGEIETLQGIVDRRVPPEDSALLSIAAALIEVEDTLDGQLVRLILPESERAPAQDEEPTDEEFRHVQDAVLRECIVNMARIKEAITQALGAPAEAQGLDQVPQLVRGITAGLLMLGKQRAVEIMEQLGRALGAIVRPDVGALASPRLEKLADAIVSVEYYMEMLQAGRPEPWRMLDHAEEGLAALEPAMAGKIVALRPRAEPEPAPLEPLAPPAAKVVLVEAPSAPVTVAPPPAPASVPATVTLADPEFVQLFVEEARENVARLQSLFPQWEQNPLDTDALREVRRVFHTLKGSGRMVGARRISEFSWSIESLLNRVISQTLARSPDIVAIVRESVEVLPALVDELEQGAPAALEIDALATRADALSGREAAAAAVPAVVPVVPEAAAEVLVEPAAPPVEVAAAEPSVEVAAPAMDPVLQEIFRKETAGHVAVVRSYIERCGQAVAPYTVTEALYRACHTLSGIAKTAGARQGIKVAEPMERYVRKLHDNGHGLPEEGLALLRDTVRGLENVIEHVAEDTGFFPDHGRLVAGWHALERALDAELAHLTEAGERTVASLWLEQPPLPEPAEPSELPAEVDHDYAAPQVALAPPPPDVEPPADTIAPPPEAEPEPEPEPEPEFDSDIAAIFSEEASELLEQSDAALLNWSRDRADRSQVTELKRLLHTLKGGARMAGIRAMGDLSHEMESFLAALESGSVASDQDAIGVLQASLDELHRMRDTVGAGNRIAPATGLIARVHAVAAASSRAPVPVEAPVDVEVVAPAEVPAEPVIETAPVVEVAAPIEAAAAVAAAEWETTPEPAAEVPPFMVPAEVPTLPGREPATPAERHELARVAAELLDELLNNAGEVSIFRARVEQQMTSTEFNLAELGRTVTRLREQLRKLELETEAQILFKHQEEAAGRADFDPLELDRYSTIQQLSRALAESVSDVASIEGLLANLNREGQNLLQQQGRVVADLQNGLMRTRMVPFQRHAQRLTRLVRQAAQEAGKQVELVVEGASGELDRQVLERMLPPFEHMLRNAVVHGIESPEARRERGKPEAGTI